MLVAVLQRDVLLAAGCLVVFAPIEGCLERAQQQVVGEAGGVERQLGDAVRHAQAD